MVAQRKVAIVTDSSACLPHDLVEQWAISVVPHTLIIDGAILKDGVDIDAAEFYHLLSQGSKEVTTSAPTPKAFEEAFTHAYSFAPDVLCIVVASQFSAAYDAAQVARTNVGRHIPGLRVHVLDSCTAAGAAALLVLDAAKEAASGADLVAITQRAEGIVPHLRVLGTLKNLNYLRSSGRVGWLASSAASALRINPVFELHQGVPYVLYKPRSRARAIEQMLTYMRQVSKGQPLDVNVMEADTASEGASLSDTIRDKFDCRQLLTSQMTPVIGAHTGPGLLGVAFCPALE